MGVARVQAECPAFLGSRAQARVRAGVGVERDHGVGAVP